MPPRLLVIMGSGETTPTMAKVHRQIFASVADQPGPAVLVDTPYGFQANADDITSKAVGYFRQSVGVQVVPASLRRPEAAPAQEVEAALAEVADARWLFCGPGSPTYALRQWAHLPWAQLLKDKLSHGGAVVFSSAAAMSLGRFSVPVYEIYKVGAEVKWADGLDVMSYFGWEIAVVAHFDNAEGGNHDTRYCYLGEPRLRTLERQLPSRAWVLGVDEHTACLLDLESERMTVAGLGTVTVRAQGRSHSFSAGEVVPLSELAATAARVAGRERDGEADVAAKSVGSGGGHEGTQTGEAGQDGRQVAHHKPTPGPGPQGRDGNQVVHDPLMDDVRHFTAAFDQALQDRDAGTAMQAVFQMEQLLHAWAADTAQSDRIDRARAALRRMLARLGELAAIGLREPRTVFAPWVGAMLEERSQARQDKRFTDSDRIRDRLVDLGVEVRDTPDGSQWELRRPSS